MNQRTVASSMARPLSPITFTLSCPHLNPRAAHRRLCGQARWHWGLARTVDIGDAADRPGGNRLITSIGFAMGFQG
jgi:hypothetical protein